VLLLNLGACGVIAVSALWLVTDCAKTPLVRLCFGLMMCGAMVNTVALWTALDDAVPDQHATWPPEAVLNMGAAFLIVRRAMEGARSRASAKAARGS
jgi:hypothetical protein